MKTTVYILWCNLLFLLAVSCDNISCGTDKNAYMDNFYNLVQTVRTAEKNNTLSDSDWQQYDEKLRKLTEDCYVMHQEKLSAADKVEIAACTGFYLYAKYGMSVVMKIGQQSEAIQEVLQEIDPMLLMKVAQEIINNPKEIQLIMEDFEKRYGN